MGLTEIKDTININYYPTFIENEMNIEFPNEISGEAKIAIYSISGQRVFSQTFVRQIVLVILLSFLYQSYKQCGWIISPQFPRTWIFVMVFVISFTGR